ncbi:MAG: hypothetical protein JXQ73_13970 [Phycisphaerae bacterium]|nr:hypothetical protein [Phycisphaerae bacterium]
MLNRVLAAVGRMIVRLYALALILVVACTTLLAVAYLVGSLLEPAPVPKRFLEWEGRVTVEDLRKGEPAEEEGSLRRTPIGHYHALGRWIQPSPHDGCTTGGCHSPLPHARHVATRAFANFHAVFLTCQMCHRQYKDSVRPVAATWVSTSAGEPQEPPPILKLTTALETEVDRIETDPGGVHGVIVDLLRASLKSSGGDPLLSYLLAQIETSEPGSPVWRQAVRQLTEELPQHMRGEYGARLAPSDVAKDYLEIDEQLEEQAREYLAMPQGSTGRKSLSERIHAGQLPKPRLCMACHIEEPPMLDFQALGYSPTRVTVLRTTPLVRQMLRIQQGQPFRLPRVLGRAPTTTQGAAPEGRNVP